MNALTHHQVRQRNTRSQYSHPHFTTFRLGALFFNHLKRIGPAILSDDDSRMFHEP
jgi:hypothetical protein